MYKPFTPDYSVDRVRKTVDVYNEKGEKLLREEFLSGPTIATIMGKSRATGYRYLQKMVKYLVTDHRTDKKKYMAPVSELYKAKQRRVGNPNFYDPAYQRDIALKRKYGS